MRCRSPTTAGPMPRARRSAGRTASQRSGTSSGRTCSAPGHRCTAREWTGRVRHATTDPAARRRYRPAAAGSPVWSGLPALPRETPLFCPIRAFHGPAADLSFCHRLAECEARPIRQAFRPVRGLTAKPLADKAFDGFGLDRAGMEYRLPYGGCHCGTCRTLTLFTGRATMLNKRREGFTLIELLIVVVIIGILAAIAIPKFSATREKAYYSAMKSDLRNLQSAQEMYY